MHHRGRLCLDAIAHRGKVLVAGRALKIWLRGAQPSPTNRDAAENNDEHQKRSNGRAIDTVRRGGLKSRDGSKPLGDGKARDAPRNCGSGTQTNATDHD